MSIERNTARTRSNAKLVKRIENVGGSVSVSDYRRLLNTSEHDEQVSVINYCDATGVLVFAIPNGSNKSVTAAHRFKAEGLKSGIPDLMVPVARGVYHGLFLEMKRTTGKLSDITDNQKHWLALLSPQGYCVKVAYGAEMAIRFIQEYMRGEA